MGLFMGPSPLPSLPFLSSSSIPHSNVWRQRQQGEGSLGDHPVGGISKMSPRPHELDVQTLDHGK